MGFRGVTECGAKKSRFQLGRVSLNSWFLPYWFNSSFGPEWSYQCLLDLINLNTTRGTPSNNAYPGLETNYRAVPSEIATCSTLHRNLPFLIAVGKMHQLESWVEILARTKQKFAHITLWVGDSDFARMFQLQADMHKPVQNITKYQSVFTSKYIWWQNCYLIGIFWGWDRGL